MFDTGDKTKPYAYSGTCYPVKYNGALFLVSAFHCYDEFGIKPENTLYPCPDGRSCFAFDSTHRAHARQAVDSIHDDQVVLRVARSHHCQKEMDQICALDLADPANAMLPTHNDIKDFYIRGYPHDAPGHSIHHDIGKIRQQAYSTNGRLGACQSPHDYCYLVRVITPIPTMMHPNGMSGAPLYGITDANRPVYCGTIIGYALETGEYVVIGPEILVNCLRGLRTDTPTATDS